MKNLIKDMFYPSLIPLIIVSCHLLYGIAQISIPLCNFLHIKNKIVPTMGKLVRRQKQFLIKVLDHTNL